MAAQKLRLPRLPVGWKDQPQLFERYWDDAMTQLEKTLNAILDIPNLQQALTQAEQAVKVAKDAADSAQQAADTANQAASGASDQTLAQAKEQSINNSYVTGFTGSLLVGNANGSVTISDHQRVYGDATLNPAVSVTGATLATTATAGQTVRVYYDDPTRAGGAVSYQYTIDPAAPPVQSGDRHSVGIATIPAAGQPPEDGDYVKPPGYVPRRTQSQPLQ